VKELQAKYANDTETLQIETARLYKEAGVNPLAGCLPTLATIPVFIGLYRALTKAADDGLLTSGFFWIPSLGGPTTMTARQAVRSACHAGTARLRMQWRETHSAGLL
jgi:YidC/Oxa1 family membrane protein insertase